MHRLIRAIWGILALMSCYFIGCEQPATITTDTSAIPVFWEIADSLSADQVPSDSL
ncbi:MAG: hypothetical protein AAF598_12660 [Bacteroidota bacterium]